MLPSKFSLLITAIRSRSTIIAHRNFSSLFEIDGKRPKLPESGNCWIAPTANVIGDVVLKENTSVWFGTTIRGDNDTITIGENTNVQENSVLHTDEGVKLNIGKNVTIGHMVMLHGCDIGDNTLIGIGSVILNNVKIGKNCLIGANTFLPEGKIIPDNSMVLGSPGKVVKEVSDEHQTLLVKGAQHYVANMKKFKSKLKPI